MYRVGPSRIHGLGVFAGRPIRKGEVMPLLPMDSEGFNTSCVPNVSPKDRHEERHAMRDILEGEEMTVHYRIMGACNCGNCHRPELDAYRNPPTCRCHNHAMPMIQQGLPSQIHGVGVFAVRAIRRGEPIIIPPIGLNKGFNSSCVPNIVTDLWEYPVALRDIRPGEELLSNYPIEAYGRGPCRCGNCPKKE